VIPARDGQRQPGCAYHERLRRWRLMLGGEEADGTGVQLRGEDAEIDQALAALYDSVHPAVLAVPSPRSLPSLNRSRMAA